MIGYWMSGSTSWMQTAIVMCRDYRLPLRVFNLGSPGELLRIMRGEDIGTLVTND